MVTFVVEIGREGKVKLINTEYAHKIRVHRGMHSERKVLGTGGDEEGERRGMVVNKVTPLSRTLSLLPPPPPRVFVDKMLF